MTRPHSPRAAARSSVGATGTLVVVLASASMAVFGIVLASLGASLPFIITRFGIDKAAAGALLALMSFAILAASLVFGPVVDRRGYKGVLMLSFGAIIVGLQAIAFAPTLGWLRFGVLLTGFSGGLLNGAANALVADVVVERRAAALTFVGGFFGIGAAGVPLLIALLAGRVPHATILGVVGAIVAGPLVFSALITYPPEKHPHGIPAAQARALLRDPVLLTFGVMLFLESGIETTVGGWITTFFADDLRVPAERASLFLSIFWVGLMLTRLTLGVLLRAASSMRVLYVSVALGFASALVLVLARGVVPAAIAVFLLGCGFAPMFPIVYAFVGDRFARMSGTALSIVIAMALCGGILMPYVVGVLAARYSLRTGFLLVPLALMGLAGLLAGSGKRLAVGG